MTEAAKTDEGSAFVIFKFALNILCHLPPDHLLQEKPNVYYEINPRMRTVADVINALRVSFNIPINMRMVGLEEALLLPQLPAKEFHHCSNSFRVEAQPGECAIGATSDGGDVPLSLEVNNQAEVIPRKISVVKRVWRRLFSRSAPSFPALSSHQAAGGGKRLAGLPAPCDAAPAKRQRPAVTQDQNDSPVGLAEEATQNLVPNPIQPEIDSPKPVSLTSLGHPKSTFTSQETSSSLSSPNKKVSWSPASYEDVKSGHIIELKWKGEQTNSPVVALMRQVEVEDDGISGAGDFDWFVNKSDIQGIKMLKINGEAFYERDNGGSWTLAGYEDVKAGQIIELKWKDEENAPQADIVRVTEVKEDVIVGFWGDYKWSVNKSAIEEIKILQLDGKDLYEERSCDKKTT